jgi:hypothetical protein
VAAAILFGDVALTTVGGTVKQGSGVSAGVCATSSSKCTIEVGENIYGPFEVVHTKNVKVSCRIV